MSISNIWNIMKRFNICEIEILNGKESEEVLIREILIIDEIY